MCLMEFVSCNYLPTFFLTVLLIYIDCIGYTQEYIVYSIVYNIFILGLNFQ